MVNSSVSGRATSKSWMIVGSFATTILFVLFLCIYFVPTWESNDDIAMSMVAHGYGIAAPGSPPTLIFSNVLWGYITRVIPEIKGILGYSIATLSVLTVVGSMIVYGLLRLGIGYIASLPVLALLLMRPVLFPQFTINAGLLMVAAIICCQLYSRQNDKKLLIASALFAFLSYLVRSEECILVVIAALPLINIRTLLSSTYARMTLLALISAILISAMIDHQHYQRAEWNSFKELNVPRALFTDFGAGDYLQKRPDILETHDYSKNDINLINHWFFVDPNIANPKTLRAMLKELGPLPIQHHALAKAWLGIKTLWNIALLPTLIAAILLTLLRPNRRLISSWLLCLGAVFMLGLIGRPAILRVYIPLVCLLLIASLFNMNISGWRKYLCTGILLVAAAINTVIAFSESRTLQINNAAIRKTFTALPNDSTVVWGAGLRFEALYPVLTQSPTALHYQLYGLGVFTLAPFSVAYAEQKAGRGMIERLMSKNGIPIIAYESSIQILGIYCNEHYHKNLKQLSVQPFGDTTLQWIRCDS